MDTFLPPWQRLFSGPALRLLLVVLPAVRMEYALYIGGCFLFSICALLPAQLLHYFAVSLSKVSAADLTSFLVRIGGLGAAMALGLAVSVWGRMVAKEWLQLRLETMLKKRILERFHRMPVERMESAQRGDWLTRVSGDVRAVEEFVGVLLPDLLQSMSLVVVASGILLFYSGPIALVLVVAAVALVVVNMRVQRRLRPSLVEMRTLHGDLFQILIENLEGWKTIRSCDAAQSEMDRAEIRLEDFRTRGFAVARRIGGAVAMSELTVQALTTICLGVLAWRVGTGVMTVEAALYYPFYLGQFFFAVRGLTVASGGWVRFAVPAERLGAILHEGSGGEERAIDGVFFRDGARGPREVRVRGLSVGHSGGPTLLENVEIALRLGEVAALVGPSGSGKSTLLETLAGLRPSARGTLTTPFETTWSTPKTLPLSWSAYVEQRPYLFDGTLRSNLNFSQRDVSDAEMRSALECVGLWNAFVPRGELEMRLADRGKNVSEGQRYRIAIARALLLRRPFLLLDEPFAALDAAAVEQVVEVLMRVKREVGVLLVTHVVPKGLRPDHFYRIHEPKDSSTTRLVSRLGFLASGSRGVFAAARHSETAVN